MANYWYNCDGINDIGWGCGWRTFQNINSRLLGQETTFDQLEEALVSLGLEVKNNNGRRVFADAEWFVKYYRSLGMNVDQHEINDTPQLTTLLSSLEETEKGGYAGVLIAAGYIVAFFEVDGVRGFFVDPHVYGEVDEMPQLTTLSQGGIGWYSFVKALVDDLQNAIPGVDDTYTVAFPTIIVVSRKQNTHPPAHEQ